MNTLKLNIDNAKQKAGVWAKILPIFVLISFIWLHLYSTTADLNVLNIHSTGFKSIEAYSIMSILMSGLFDYLIFELVFFLYKFILGFSIYSFIVPRDILNFRFRFWFIIRNIILGLIFNLRFFYPYIGTYLCVFELTLNMALLIWFYFDIKRDYVEPLVGQFVFKTLSVPFVIYEVIVVISMMVGVL